LITSCLLATVAVLTWRNSDIFNDFLNRQIEDQAVQQAKDATNRIDAHLENWYALMTYALQDASGADQTQFESAFRKLLFSDPDFIGLQLFKNVNGTIVPVVSEFNGHEDIRYEDQKASDVRQKIEKYTARHAESERSLLDLKTEVGLPIVSISRRFMTKGDNNELIVWLTAWQSKLIKILPNTKKTFGYLLDAKGGPLLTAFPKTKLESFLEFHTFALSGESFGFHRVEAANKNGQRLPYMAAFDRSRLTGATTVVIRDGTDSYTTIKKIILRTALWTWAFFCFCLMVSYLGAKGITKKLKALTATTLRIASGDFTGTLDAKGKDEVSLLSTSVNHMSEKIQQLLELQVHKARQDKELETAKMVQSTFFPKENLSSRMFNFDGETISATQCGGDWWGSFSLKSSKEIIVIADATGHGTPAALVTAMAYTGYEMIYSQLVESEEEDPSPTKILRRMNQLLYKTGHGKISMTSVVAVVDSSNGMMRYANAGHNPPYLIPKSDGDDRLQKKSTFGKRKREHHFALSARGNPLGLDADWKAQENTVQLHPEDRIVLYTDGIFECTNPQGEAWGSRRFRLALTTASKSQTQNIRSTLLAEVGSHLEGTAPDDDITLVVAEVKSDWKPQIKAEAS
jgi:serine phosphatase RsbU (regulator of sigma subunit)